MALDHFLSRVPDSPVLKAGVIVAGLPALAHELVYIVMSAPMAVYYGLLAWRDWRESHKNKGGKDGADAGQPHQGE